MTVLSRILRRVTLCALLLPIIWSSPTGLGAPLVLYSTQFETSEGLDSSQDLAGQDGWISFGTGGNGLTDWNAIYGYEQSAFVGFNPLTPDGLYVWRPINHTPTSRPVVTVEFDMSVTDSSTTNRDEFRWSVYNILGEWLFSLVFDIRDLEFYPGVGVYQLLDDNQFQYTGWEIYADDVYSTKVQMDFSANRWNAWLGGIQIVTNKLITTKNASLTFGDIDAVWLPGYSSGAGDNFMVFDDFSVTADAAIPAASSVEVPLPVGNGQYLIRVNGTEGAKFAVEASTNLSSWISLKTNVVSGGYFDFLDTSAAGLSQRFYRSRFVP